MKNVPAIAHDFEPLTTDDWKALFVPAFKHYVGTYGRDGKILTVKQIATALNRQPRTVESWRDGQNLPGFADLMNLIGLLPSGFGNRLLGAHGVGGLRDLTMSDITVHHIAEGAAGFSMRFINWMSDNRIDHREKAESESLVRRMRDHCDQFLANIDANRPAVMRVIAGYSSEFAGGAQ